MPDGTGNFDAPLVTSEPLRQLNELPESVNVMVGGLTHELAALELGPKYPPSVRKEHSFRDGLLENARLLWTHRTEIEGLVEDLTGEAQGETAILSLVKAAILTDFGKLGPDRLTGEVPQNIVARVYRELRWEQAHVDWLKDAENFKQIEPLLLELTDDQRQMLRENGKGRTLIPFKAAVDVMRRVALEKYPDDEVGINQVFTITAADEAELSRLGLSVNTPLSKMFTALHSRANAELLPKLQIGIPEKDYAVGHHFTAGIELLPESVVKDYQLDGKDFGSQAFVNYVVNVALLSATDRTQGFVQRSGKTPNEANQLTVKSILNEIQTNFSSSHPRKDQITTIFASVMAFVVSQKFADYYAN